MNNDKHIAVFSAKSYDKTYFEQAKISAKNSLSFSFIEAPLSANTLSLALGCSAICVFVNDKLTKEYLALLAKHGLKLIILRCAGYNNIDIDACREFKIQVMNVPAYSPEAVAEHTIALILTLNRKLHKAYNRVKDDNFSLKGLLGFNLNLKTVGIVGTGRIGLALIKILNGFGCNVIAFDTNPRDDAEQLGFKYVNFETLLSQSEIISLHCPLTLETQHMINHEAISKMKDSVMLINTSRGGLVDTQAVIDALKCKKIGNLGLDVYEQESSLFFEDLSNTIIQDDIFQRLLTFPNVLITGHQGFFTHEALTEIANVCIKNIEFFRAGKQSGNELVRIEA